MTGNTGEINEHCNYPSLQPGESFQAAAQENPMARMQSNWKSWNENNGIATLENSSVS